MENSTVTKFMLHTSLNFIHYLENGDLLNSLKFAYASTELLLLIRQLAHRLLRVWIEHFKRYWNRPVAYPICRSVCVCVSGKCTVSKRITVTGCRFGWWLVSEVGRGMGVLDRGHDRLMGRDSFEGEFGASHCNQWEQSILTVIWLDWEGNSVNEWPGTWQTPYKKWRMAYRPAIFDGPVWFHAVITGRLKCGFLYSCAGVDHISTGVYTRSTSLCTPSYCCDSSPFADVLSLSIQAWLIDELCVNSHLDNEFAKFLNVGPFRPLKAMSERDL